MNTAVQRRPAVPGMDDLVRTHRERLGLTRSQLADKTGLSMSMITKIEMGERSPTPRTIRELSQILGRAFRKEAQDLLMERP